MGEFCPVIANGLPDHFSDFTPEKAGAGISICQDPRHVLTIVISD